MKSAGACPHNWGKCSVLCEPAAPRGARTEVWASREMMRGGPPEAGNRAGKSPHCGECRGRGTARCGVWRQTDSFHTRLFIQHNYPIPTLYFPLLLPFSKCTLTRDSSQTSFYFYKSTMLALSDSFLACSPVFSSESKQPHLCLLSKTPSTQRFSRDSTNIHRFARFTSFHEQICSSPALITFCRSAN